MSDFSGFVPRPLFSSLVPSSLRAQGTVLTGKFPSSNQQTRGQGEMGTRRSLQSGCKECGKWKLGFPSPCLPLPLSPCLINRGRISNSMAQGTGLRAQGTVLTGKFPSSNQQTRGQGEMGTRRSLQSGCKECGKWKLGFPSPCLPLPLSPCLINRGRISNSMAQGTGLRA